MIKKHHEDEFFSSCIFWLFIYLFINFFEKVLVNYIVNCGYYLSSNQTTC